MLAYDAKKAPPAFGLENTGVICYFNSLLQALVGCSSMADAVLSQEAYMRKTSTGTAVFEFFRAATRPGVAPEDLRRHSESVLSALRADLASRQPKANFGRGQESASEALVLLLDMLEAPDDPDAAEEPLITSLFTGRYRCTSVCRSCRQRVEDNEDYTVCFDLFHLVESSARPSTPSGFEKVLRHHVSEGDGDYFCRNCDKRVCIVRAYDLLLIPEILVLQFNRYEGRLGKGSREPLYFPERFAVPAKEPGTALGYRLVAQVEHAGSLSGGHYWARALRSEGKVWTLNDTSVTPGSFAPSGETYLLFYHYTGVEPAAAPGVDAKSRGPQPGVAAAGPGPTPGTPPGPPPGPEANSAAPARAPAGSQAPTASASAASY